MTAQLALEWPAYSPDMLPRRFAAKVRVDDNGCWIFDGCLNSRGYGCIQHDGKVQLTHRVSYTLLVAPIPDGLQIDHICRVRACCRPDHVEPVTHIENQLRSPLTPLGQTHCKNGHPLSGDNLRIIGKRQQRRCVTCMQDYLDTNREAKRAMDREGYRRRQAANLRTLTDAESQALADLVRLEATYLP